MSWNTLEVAAELGINRVVLASSVNAIGMGGLCHGTY
jgi:nucleoside-diphosphate-sugar epimerase